MASKIDYDGSLTLASHCTDLKRSLEWYTTVLGFNHLYTVDNIGWCEMQTPVEGGRVAFGLSQVEEVKPGGLTPTFGVRDIDAARAYLESKKVRFDGPTREYPGLVRLAVFFDPDGNTLMLSQSLGSE